MEFKIYTESEVKNFSTEELNDIVNKRNQTINNLYNNTVNKLHSILKSHDINWIIRNISTTQMNLVNNIDNYRYEINFNYGYGFMGDEPFKFEMNTSCFGSFNVFEDNGQTQYFITVGKILSNYQLKYELSNTIKTYVKCVEAIRDAVRPVFNELTLRKKEEENKQILIERQTKLNEFKSYIKENENSKLYVVIKEVYGNGMCTYRKKQYDIISINNDIYEANRSSRKNYNAKIVEFSKIKLNNI